MPRRPLALPILIAAAAAILVGGFLTLRPVPPPTWLDAYAAYQSVHLDGTPAGRYAIPEPTRPFHRRAQAWANAHGLATRFDPTVNELLVVDRQGFPILRVHSGIIASFSPTPDGPSFDPNHTFIVHYPRPTLWQRLCRPFTSDPAFELPSRP